MDKDFNELIAAYCVGCLERETKKEFNYFVQLGGQINFQELGEYQNLVALLPSMLPLEQPGSEIKDKVAKKLYKIRDEVKKIRRLNTLKKGANPYILEELEPVKEEPAQKPEEPVIKEEKTVQQEHAENKAPGQQPAGDIKFKGRTPPSSLYPPHKKNPSKPAPPLSRKKAAHENEEIDNLVIREDDEHLNYDEPLVHKHATRNYPLLIGGFLLFFLVVIGIIWGYIQLTGNMHDYKSEIDRLNNKLNSISLQQNSKEVQDLLNSPNVKIINLDGTKINQSGYGKLIISNNGESGFIQFAYMPALPENSVYQLWLSMSGSMISLGTFKPYEPVGYYPVKMPSMPEGYRARLIVTLEHGNGSKKPGYNIFLTGSL